MNLKNSLEDLIRKSPGRSAREYSRKLNELGFGNIDKSQVNSIFYSNLVSFEFCKDNNGTPRWFLRDLALKPTTSKPIQKVKSIKATKSIINLYPWQKEALAEWKAQGYKGVVEAVTGAGKTRVGISAANEELEQDGFVLVIVPSLELLGQWKKSLEEYLPREARIGIFGNGSKATFKYYDVIVATVNAARENKLLPRDNGGLLIADECHRYGSECSRNALDERYTRRLGLSATYQRNDNGNVDFLEPYFGSVCFKMDYARAIEDGVISKFSVALIGVSFSYSERFEYDEYSKKLSQLRKKLINNFEVVEEPFGEFMKEVTLLSKGGHSDATAIARTYLSIFEKRRKLLAETPSKMNGLIKLVDAIRSANRTLIFTQTIESVENVAETLKSFGVNIQATHSELKMNERRQVLQEFEDGDLQVVVAPKVLDEGIDVPEADLAIIIAASKTRRQMIQRMGRVLRLKNDGRIARFALLFVEGTSEDPTTGAHEEFIDEITEVAVSVETFSPNSPAEKICQYLSQTRQVDFTPERRMIHPNLQKIPRQSHRVY